MTNIRNWIDKGDVSAERAQRALPILVRQARAEQPITYLDLSRELGMRHHRPVKTPAGYIGYTLEAIGHTHGWKRRPPPPLQCLVVNKSSGLPGNGVDEFMSDAYRQAQTSRQKKAALRGVYSQIYSYPFWEEILDILQIGRTPIAQENVIEQAVNAKGRGGEGPEHRALKDYVAVNPYIVGLPSKHTAGNKEIGLPSGDRIDVVFEGGNYKVAVEVKSYISSLGDIARGMFQCLKYRTILEAQSALSQKSFEVTAILVIGGALPKELIPLKNSLNVTVIEEVVVGVKKRN